MVAQKVVSSKYTVYIFYLLLMSCKGVLEKYLQEEKFAQKYLVFYGRIFGRNYCILIHAFC